jgi:hypothetical protein
LFNKTHDKKYKLKGIPLPYVIYTLIILFIVFIYWASTGGMSKVVQAVIPDVSNVDTQILSTNISPYESPVTLPSQDPFIDSNTSSFEIPNLIYTNSDNKQNDKFFEILTEEQNDLNQNYFFGDTRKCKLVFVSDKTTDSKSTGFSFSASWNDFAQLNKIDLSFEKGVWMVRTSYFLSFLEWIRDKGKGASLKEIDLTLKENCLFKLEHGYEIPIESSFATQGMIQSQTTFKQVGFSLDLLFQSIQKNELLKVELTNSDVMDMTTDVPVLQTFHSSNIVDVKPQMTYQIADFKSTTASQSKGIFSSSSVETTITNKLFIIYGDI